MRQLEIAMKGMLASAASTSLRFFYEGRYEVVASAMYEATGERPPSLTEIRGWIRDAQEAAHAA